MDNQSEGFMNFRRHYNHSPEEFLRVYGVHENGKITSDSLTAEERWNFCKKDLLSLIGMSYNRVRVSSMEFHAYSDENNLLTIRIPDHETYDYIENILSTIFYPILMVYFQNTQLNYFIPHYGK